MNFEQELRPGALLRHNTYRIERVLGQGGFGITYLATDLNLERKVAIKEFFPKDYCGREGSTSQITLGTQSATEFVNKLKAKFLKEARNIARFDHPGIIKIHAAFEENNTAYYVMDYIEGESLSEMVKGSGPISPERAADYIEKVGDALEYVHKHKINHLDIKPANIMVRFSDNRPILIDFGLSKQYDSSGNQTSTTPTGISHGFAPMEQYNAAGVREFSPQTDLYSLAATLFYILSGVVPPQAITLVEEPLTFPDRIPASMRAAIAKAMSPMRRMRHETIKEFVAEIAGKETDGHTHIVVPQQHDEATVMPQQVCTPQTPEAHIVTGTVPESVKNTNRKWFIIIGSAVIVCAIFLIFFTGGGKGSVNITDVVVPEDSVGTLDVVNCTWSSPLGLASYTGQILNIDTVNLIPHGIGTARIISGEYKGNVYSGNFEDGKMEGQATYTLANGDKFEGTYHNNKYYEGRYTMKATGEYFVGTFKNGQPDKGTWYNRKGEEL